MHIRTTQLLKNSSTRLLTVNSLYRDRRPIQFTQYVKREYHKYQASLQHHDHHKFSQARHNSSQVSIGSQTSPFSDCDQQKSSSQLDQMAEIQLTNQSHNSSTNHVNSSNENHQQYLMKILQRFPKVQHAFAYGSGVFHQPDLYGKSKNRADRPMIDFVLAVDDPVVWHRQNVQRHPTEYSFLQFLGPQAISYVAEVWGVGIHFNTLVPINEHQLIKYGVISVDRLCQDLRDWDTLYIAGRMHKPVLHLVEDDRVMEDLETNLEQAMTMALLLLPERFRMIEAMRVICGLSYMGDVRLGLAEDSNKVARIVEGSKQELYELYTPILEGDLGSIAKVKRIEEDTWQQDISEETRSELLARLPRNVLLQLVHQLKLGVKVQQFEDNLIRQYVAVEVVHSKGWPDRIRKAITNIVRKSSWRAAFTAFLSAGIIKSIVYVWKKLLKAMKTKQE
eukprot:TRINITY_DN5987_c1_g1_i1.p1 TRINITY_DN5987_c1_g1~~TRINITY_DN5987_c1_g1_i1.p1  ORF type:complete len:449 (+),score=33.33 TRINITY_DN5987_c1_g1_i1:83-1429(+)